MGTLSALIADGALLLGGGSLLLLGGAVLALFLLFPLFLLALIAVLSGVEDRTVRPRNASMNPTGWRDGP
jgi:hypothetical protein